MNKTMTIVERADFKRLDTIVRDGLPIWLSVGQALLEIKRRELYRQSFETWELYLNSRGLSLWQGRERIREALTYNGENILVEMGEKEAEDAPILKAKTSSQARKAVQKVTQADSEPKPSKETKAPKRDTLDNIGVALPEALIALWNRSGEPMGMVHDLQSIKRILDKAREKKDLLWAETNINAALASISDAIRQIKTAVPYALCPYCQGVRSSDCDFCYHRGLVSQFRFSTADQELVKMQMKKGKP